jgi:hypothetical protein
VAGLIVYLDFDVLCATMDYGTILFPVPLAIFPQFLARSISKIMYYVLFMQLHSSCALHNARDPSLQVFWCETCIIARTIQFSLYDEEFKITFATLHFYFAISNDLISGFDS